MAHDDFDVLLLLEKFILAGRPAQISRSWVSPSENLLPHLLAVEQNLQFLAVPGIDFPNFSNQLYSFVLWDVVPNPCSGSVLSESLVPADQLYASTVGDYCRIASVNTRKGPISWLTQYLLIQCFIELLPLADNVAFAFLLYKRHHALSAISRLGPSALQTVLSAGCHPKTYLS